MPLQGEDGQLQGTNELPESGPVKAGHLRHWMAVPKCAKYCPSFAKSFAHLCPFLPPLSAFLRISIT